MADPADPTRQRNQAALTTSSGLVWVVMGGFLTAIALLVLIPLGAVVASFVCGVLYVGMLGSRLLIRPRRVRLGVLCGLMLAIAAVALTAVLWAAATAG